ncbi:site-specific integrase [Dysgonomonas sp.]|jgi:integrase|uniref:site-specific integrase n=1 Tax=Dysgonomonas sp. TaxID=1891233 RepID=UPI00282F00D1|nr:site-specific integrase [Dysgonomonas sp.]MDR2001681.1 site-specific integrase [Prevotella sp.]HMM04261.1 site-specific integrase [Dysgonomonas sp.]
MTATVNVVLFKSKTLANGENPLMIRVCKDNKKKYKSLGISLNAKYWDNKKNGLKPNCPNKEYIEKIILDKKAEYQTQILEQKVSNKNFTASSLINATKQTITTKTVQEFYTELIAYYRSINKVGNASIYRNSFNSLKSFKETDNLDFLFSEIDLEWLNQYEKWLISRNNAETTMSLLFRTLRSAFNKAIEQKIVRKEEYPFNSFKMSKFSVKTRKRAIAKEDIKKVIELDVTDESEMMQLSRDIFVFSYLQSGINLTDIANLKYENIIDNRLQYIRQKTNRLINIPLQEEALKILQKHYYPEAILNDYVFPILNRKVHITGMQKFNRIHKIMGKVNINLKKIAKKANIEANLTTYVARHTYATVLKRSGVNTSIISESLGHSSEKVTQIYLDSFENSQIDEAMKNLL